MFSQTLYVTTGVKPERREEFLECIQANQRCVAVCCSVLKRRVLEVYAGQSKMCCSVLQCVAVCCIVLQSVEATSFGSVCRPIKDVLQCVTVCYSVLQCVAVCCSVLQGVAVCCRVLKRRALEVYAGQSKMCRNVLQCDTATSFGSAFRPIKGVLQCVAVC